MIKSYTILIFILFISALNSVAGNLQLNIENRTIVAPEGTNYTWYQNDILVMGSNENRIVPKESGKYEVTFNNPSGELISKSITVEVTQQGVRRIYIIGDSTVQSYNSSYYPQMGWGQLMYLYFDQSKFQFVNRAIGGRSSRSFHEEGRWASVVNSLVEGDFVFIQWGHNDSDFSQPSRYTDTAQYKSYLRIYVNETRAKKAIPVLISPMIRNLWNSPTSLRNVFTEGITDYKGAMLQVAEELDVLFVDLNMLSWEYISNLSSTYAAEFLYMSLKPGEYPNYPNGLGDGGTHFQEMGAHAMASLIVKGLKELNQDQDVAALLEAQLPTYKVNISSDAPNPGLVTISGEYPVGATITMKNRMNRGNTFLRWEDGNNQLFDEAVLTTFQMEAKDYEFKAITSDCNGVVGGAGYLDDCNTCIDGVKYTKPCVNAIQGDDACLWNGDVYTATIDGRISSFSSVGKPEGDTITYVVRAIADGSYEVGIKYLKGISNLTAQVYVNGQRQIDNLSIPEGSSTEFSFVYFEVNVQSEENRGNNNITLVFPPMDSSLDISVFATYDSNVIAGTTCKSVTLLSPLALQKGVDQIFAYPNPFHSTLNLNTSEKKEYSIVNLTGVIVENGICDRNCLVGEALISGTYILQWKDQSIFVIKR